MHKYWITVDGYKIEEIIFDERPRPCILEAKLREFEKFHGVRHAKIGRVVTKDDFPINQQKDAIEARQRAGY
jgi:hypothetical protein